MLKYFNQFIKPLNDDLGDNLAMSNNSNTNLFETVLEALEELEQEKNANKDKFSREIYQAIEDNDLDKMQYLVKHVKEYQ